MGGRAQAYISAGSSGWAQRSPYLPISPHISPNLPISPHTSLYLGRQQWLGAALCDGRTRGHARHSTLHLVRGRLRARHSTLHLVRGWPRARHSTLHLVRGRLRARQAPSTWLGVGSGVGSEVGLGSRHRGYCLSRDTRSSTLGIPLVGRPTSTEHAAAAAAQRIAC